MAKANHYAKYNKPGCLKVYGSQHAASYDQLLSTSPMIAHEDWKTYTFSFVPKQEIKYITFVVSPAPGALFRYNGNVLIDNCSVIVNCISRVINGEMRIGN